MRDEVVFVSIQSIDVTGRKSISSGQCNSPSLPPSVHFLLGMYTFMYEILQLSRSILFYKNYP